MFDSPLFREKSVKKKANDLEKHVAKRLGAKQQPASGAGVWRKGDFTAEVQESAIEKVKGRKFIGDLKARINSNEKSTRVTLGMIDKLRADMHREGGEEWFLPLWIGGKLAGVVVSPEFFEEISGHGG